MHTVFCIDCDKPIRLESRPKQGEIIVCPSCGTELEVINLDPTELDWVYLDPILTDRDRKYQMR